MTAPPACAEPPACTLHRGDAPLVISMPHVGTYVPAALAARFTAAGRLVADTDWHLEALYAFAHGLGATVVAATHARYAIDLNRPSDGASLYPGQRVTGLCPVDTFADEPLYADPADVPTAAEIAARRARLWEPYHATLHAELERLRAMHPQVVLWDAHSIRSVVPRFFEGRLPDLNLGTADGASCAPALAAALLRCADASPFSAVLNGRFKGGHITRHFGQPSRGIHAVQLEMAQCTYMQESPPFAWEPPRALRVQAVLRQLVETALAFARHHS